MAIDYTRPSKNPGDKQGGVGLSKISLTKAAPTVGLAKSGAERGITQVNLNWSQGGSPTPRKQGFLAKLTGGATGRGIDLDLACLYELADGSKGVVQALGNSFGALEKPPFIALDGDDRTGAVSGGETMRIDLGQPERFRRILIFAMIYEGAPNWAAVDGVVTLTPPSGPQIEVRLDSPNNGARICAIAMLQNTGREISVSRLVEYVDGSQSDLDRAYGWGMNWAPGRK
ncbi:MULTISPECIES: tellurium resistance protein [Rhodococcus]|uniref:TerD family protein n=1 Tax=Rhodococcus TaxID=1827 RepID=UPI00193AE64C|nr:MULTISPECIES: tellurium resistance protein [Rhodococcus]QRI77106.1 tellurium resistance protein [Rhodococcus aetherivorans]QSE60527.1 tellurium resistance protein [Rhodococcus sp. PSBB066]QSE68167.1 tellurium resistance protein [Rhodococcus sp. PSBB049]